MSLISLFDSFRGKRILVVGDLMLDSYIIGNVSRISPEAPVPVLDKTSAEFRLGGAGNVALNLASLGATPIIASVIGKDTSGSKILDILKDSGASCSCIVETSTRKTTVKTRVVANKQQVIRIDEEQTDDISGELKNILFKYIKTEIDNGIEAIIFEDYNKGVLTEELIADLIALSLKHNIFTAVDPKNKNFFAYKGVHLFKPNLKELKEGLQTIIDPSNLESIENAVNLLEKKIDNKITFVTLSEYGVFIKDQSKSMHVGAHIRNIADVSGAGDSVIATATLCLAAGASLAEIAEIANIAGGLACEKSGVATISIDELRRESLRLLTN